METQLFDVAAARRDFPILDQQINGRPLVYLDNAATTQKPQVVMEALSAYYGGFNANIHRGIHSLAEKATAAFEDTRRAMQAFINAEFVEEIIFTSGTTMGINLVAQTYGRAFLHKGDEIILSGLEHHSDIVPWQLLAQEKGLHIRVIPVLQDGTLDMQAYGSLLSERTRLVAVNHVSNSLGTINPVADIIRKAHQAGAVVLVDGAQAAAHLLLDVQALEADFYAFSAHKLYGPTGMGVLYGRKALLEKMPPYMGGGEMIREVSFQETTFADLPYKFEAGTPNIGDVVAMRAAIDYVNGWSKPVLAAYEADLLAYGTDKLQQISGLRIIGTAPEKVAIISFVLEGVHPQDIGILLDQQGIAVRTGHHCTQPLMQHFGLPGTARASMAFYNTFEEMDRLADGIRRVQRMMA